MVAGAADVVLGDSVVLECELDSCAPLPARDCAVRHACFCADAAPLERHPQGAHQRVTTHCLVTVWWHALFDARHCIRLACAIAGERFCQRGRRPPFHGRVGAAHAASPTGANRRSGTDAAGAGAGADPGARLCGAPVDHQRFFHRSTRVGRDQPCPGVGWAVVPPCYVGLGANGSRASGHPRWPAAAVPARSTTADGLCRCGGAAVYQHGGRCPRRACEPTAASDGRCIGRGIRIAGCGGMAVVHRTPTRPASPV